MAGRLSIDFGTSNTVVALYDAERQTGRTTPLAGFSMPDEHDGKEFHVIPSLIHYDGNKVSVGRQVLDNDLRAAPATFSLMKTYIGNRMKLPRKIGDRKVDFFQAGGDFLKQVLLAAGSLADFAEEEVAFTVPVEAFEHYQNWLDDVVREAGVLRPVFIDEPSAAALGYGAGIRPGQAFMVFDFGGGTADASVVRIEEDPKRLCCRTLGKAGAQMGGSAIDQWIARDVLAKTGKSESEARAFMGLLLWEAERVKKALSEGDAENFTVMDPSTGAVVSHRYSRTVLEDLLENNGLYTKINSVLDMAEAQAREHGYDRSTLASCLMIGGSSLIPSVRRIVRMRYGDLTKYERPFDAVALGAAAYAAGAGFDDRIRHEYALRPYDRNKGDYVLKTIVPAGTPYPCPIMRPDKPDIPLVLTVKASNDEQTRLGLQVYEVARKESVACGGGGFDLVFDQNGAARYAAREDVEDFRCRPIGSTTFITANPPAKFGDPRFPTTFSIDAQKRLCATVKDTNTGKTLMRDYPLVKLT